MACHFGNDRFDVLYSGSHEMVWWMCNKDGHYGGWMRPHETCFYCEQDRKYRQKIVEASRAAYEEWDL